MQMLYLYLYCSSDVMSCDKDTLVVNKKTFDQKRIAKFSKDVWKGNVFGFAQVDTKYPTRFMTNLARWRHCLLFKRSLMVTYLRKLKYIRKKLAEKQWREQKSYWVLWGQKKISLYTSLTKSYLQHGLWLIAVHQSVEYKPGKPFSWFPEEVAGARYKTAKDLLKQQLGDVAKLKGNRKW